MYIALIILITPIILFVLSTAGRRGQRKFSELKKWNYAHRGLYGDGVPENSMRAFRYAKEAGFGVELDIHLMKDGNLAVIHDASLKRVAGADVFIEDLTAEDLSQYYLEGSFETIPLFSDVLKLYNGEAPLIVELKCERNNYKQLCDTACRMLDRYPGPYCLESFDPRCVFWLRRNCPDLLRGQLAENYFSSTTCKLPWILKVLLTYNILNFLTLPDFVAYRYKDRKNISNWLCRKLWRMQGVTWTVVSQGELDSARTEDWVPIFENFVP